MNQTKSSFLLSLAKLVRLPNCFTVLTNVMAAQFVFGLESWGVHLLFVLPISLAFYFAGMISNDVADFELDAKFRPERVLPSGEISQGLAFQVSMLLFLFGLAASVAYSLTIGSFLPTIFSVVLVTLIFLYNYHAKEHWYGCLVMAGCRVANIYLAASFWLPETTTEVGLSSPHLYPLGIALFIVGVTHFARNEEGTSSRFDLLVASALALCGLAAVFFSGVGAWTLRNDRDSFWMWLVLYGLMLLPMFRTAIRAIINPEPRLVQKTIGVSLRSIILLDAFVCFLVSQDRVVACCVALLFLPSFFLSRWIRSS